MILVTGGAGNIGRRLVSLLPKRSGLRVLVWAKEDDPFVHDQSVQTVRGDVSNLEELDGAFDGVTEVIHLAAAMGGSENDFVTGTLEGTENVVRLCEKYKVKRLMYLSSMSVLHLSKITISDIVDESWDYEPRPEKRGYYTKYKLLAEKVVLDAVKRSSLPACILRPAEVLFPDRPLISIAGGKEIGPAVLSFWDEDSNIALISVDDLVSIMVRLWASGDFEGEILNLSDPYLVSQGAYLAAYQRHCGISKKVVRIPFGFAVGTSRVLEGLTKPLGLQFPVTEYRLRSAVGPRVFSQDAAERYLGEWNYTGVRDYIEEKSD